MPMPPAAKKRTKSPAKTAAPRAKKPAGAAAPDLSIPLAQRRAAEIEKIMARYPVRRSGVMAVLYLAQRDLGWITPEAMEEVAEICDMQPSEVMEMVSFYTMYHRKPVGKCVLWVCGTLPCALCGAEGLVDYLKEKTGADVDEVSADGLFTIKRAECLGACSEAPLMLVNDKLETKLTRKKVDQILAAWRDDAASD